MVRQEEMKKWTFCSALWPWESFWHDGSPVVTAIIASSWCSSNYTRSARGNALWALNCDRHSCQFSCGRCGLNEKLQWFFFFFLPDRKWEPWEVLLQRTGVLGYFRKANPALERWRRRKSGKGELSWRPVHWSGQDQPGSWDQGDNQIKKEKRKLFSISFICSSLFIGRNWTLLLIWLSLCGGEETLGSDTVRPAQRWAHEETNCNAEQGDSLHLDPSPTQSLLEAECPRSRRLIDSMAT